MLSSSNWYMVSVLSWMISVTIFLVTLLIIRFETSLRACLVEMDWLIELTASVTILLRISLLIILIIISSHTWFVASFITTACWSLDDSFGVDSLFLFNFGFCDCFYGDLPMVKDAAGVTIGICNVYISNDFSFNISEFCYFLGFAFFKGVLSLTFFRVDYFTTSDMSILALWVNDLTELWFIESRFLFN